MLWFYEREQLQLRLETRYDNASAEYVAVLVRPDGRQETHRFQRAEAFQQWLKTLEQTLIDDRWTQKGSPEILPDGWPDKLPLM